jgi:FkbM family methyltransferase
VKAVPKFGDLRRKLIKGLRSARNPAFRSALRRGVAPSIEHREVPLPPEIATVFDVGANRGQFMLFACERFPSAELFCFEPLDAAREKLRTVAPNKRSINVFPYALAESGGQASFHVAEADDSSSLLPAAAAQVELFPSSRVASIVDVETKRLDQLFTPEQVARPSLLKIDVQGGELSVLRGSERLLGAIDFVFVECSFIELYSGQPLFDEVIEFLRSRGFRLEGLHSATVSATGSVIQADGLFTRVAGGARNDGARVDGDEH